MRRGRTEEASALAHSIYIYIYIYMDKDIVRHNRSRLSKLQGKSDIKDVWAAVQQLSGRVLHQADVDGVDAHSLNMHYTSNY